MVFLPAVAMRLWAEETRSGAIETAADAAGADLVAGAGQISGGLDGGGVALLLTFPLWITVNFLGHAATTPRSSPAISRSFLMAGAYIAIGSAMSALTQAQVVAFVLAVLVSFLLTALGLPLVSDFFARLRRRLASAETISRFSILVSLRRRAARRRGVPLGVLFLLSLIALCLGFTALAVDARRGG